MPKQADSGRDTRDATAAAGSPVSFEKPPVIETVLGFQFQRLGALTGSQLAAFWRQLGGDWPEVDFAPPLEEQSERFGDLPDLSKLRLRVMQEPRLRIRKVSGDRMIQVQNGRFHYNWIGQQRETYPRYADAVRPEFLEALRGFLGFVEANDLGEVNPNQWEVTYVNHLLKGTVWHKPGDWVDLFNGLPGPFRDTGLARLEGFSGHWRYEIPDRRGRLHVEIKHAQVGAPPGQEAVVMTLTARGSVDEDEGAVARIERGLDLGHRVIVESFRDLASQEARRHWGEIA